jgi:flagellar biosynthesis protein FlhA
MSQAVASPNNLLTLLKSKDIQLAVGILAIVFMMIVPLPPFLLDILLSVSVTASVLVLLVSVYIREPLEFSTFPSILLISTLFRLSLNVATTRSILLSGPQETVSEVVTAFGNFVVGGNYFVGLVIFAILIVINFMVITKGAGRVAEVGARFTLDAMPGKQMAIDAELNAGLIDKEEAKRRRTKIERESDFYGAMDGASKFVKGDAIAAIIITLINIVVGLLIGVIQHQMSLSAAAEKYTILTVGDGLISQIPALIISVAAGMVVTRAASDKSFSEDINTQLLIQPKPMYIAASLMCLLALIPGLPFIPFMCLALGCYYLGRFAASELVKRAADAAVAAKQSKEEVKSGDDSIESFLSVDVLALEVGVGLIPMVDSEQDGEVLERIVSSRKQFAQDLGIVVPMIMVRDNIQLKPGEYQIMLKGNPIASGNLMPDYFMAMAPDEIADPVEGLRTKEPAYGLDAVWIKASQKDEATFRGYTVVNCSTVIVTHLTKVISENCASLLGRQDTQVLIDGLKQKNPKVVEEVIQPDGLALGDVVKIMQNLLAENVSIRDLLTIFETIADHCRTIKHPDALTRHVRKALGRSIVRKYLDAESKLVVCSLDRAVEDLLISGLHQNEDGTTSLNVEPEIAQTLLNNIATGMDKFQASSTMPILLCGSRIRWDIQKLVNRFIPGLTVLAFDEVPQDVKTKNLGIISI